MVPVCMGVPEALPRRLQAQGLQGWVMGTQAPAGWQATMNGDDIPRSGPFCWLAGPGQNPPLQPGDILLRCIPDSALHGPAPLAQHADPATLTWQDSPFAIEHGFMLFVGGPPAVLQQAAPVLDALAPLPGGWLVVGDALAPVFVAQVLQQLGLGITHLAGFAAVGDAPDWPAILDGQRALLTSSATLATRYLQATQGGWVAPRMPQAEILGWPLQAGSLGDPGHSDPDTQPSIAVKLAQWLLLVAACMLQPPGPPTHPNTPCP
jgi:hypothetical protein